MEIRQLLQEALDSQASDLHVSAGLAPRIRVNGQLHAMHYPALEHKDVFTMLCSVMSDAKRQIYEQQMDIDFAFEIPHLARFRVNAFNQIRGAAANFRMIPHHILSLDELKLPPIIKDITQLTRGLVLVTGPTGCGKSTTLAAMVHHINHTRRNHILTIEDPIEFIHPSKNCLIQQREIVQHTQSFNAALRSALRADPDIILIGELRDLETIRLAMTAAETGHLVLASLHTQTAAQTIHRMIDVFAAEEKTLRRLQLADSLQAVIAQQLVPSIANGRVAAMEIMNCTHAIRHLIREDKIAQIQSCIQTGQSQGMQTLEQHLMQLKQNGII